MSTDFLIMRDVEQKVSLRSIVKKYIKDNQGPAQRTALWFLSRKNNIGGSLVSTVLGQNKYKNPKQMLLLKCGLKLNGPFGLACTWGTILEHFTTLWAGMLTGAKIYLAGQMPGFTEGQLYSPDGVGVVKMRLGNVDRKVITLFEFKSPWSQINLGKCIPDHYVDQVNAGLASLDICTQAIFVSNVFKVSSLKSLDNPASYNSYLHSSYKLPPMKNIMAVGIVYFHNKSKMSTKLILRSGAPQDPLNLSSDLSDFDLDFVYDVGNLHSGSVANIFNYFSSENKLVTVSYSNLYKSSKMNINYLPMLLDVDGDTKTCVKLLTLLHELKLLSNSDIFAFMPIKLYDSKVVHHILNKLWTRRAKKTINLYISVMRKVISMDKSLALTFIRKWSQKNKFIRPK